MRKQQEAINAGDLLFNSFRTTTDQKYAFVITFTSDRDSTSHPRLNEYRDLFNEIKSRLDFEREDRRLVESQLASKYVEEFSSLFLIQSRDVSIRLNDMQSTINTTRSTQSEIVKTMENLRRENVSQVEQVYNRIRQEMTDLNGQILQRTTDKIDRLRDDMDYRAKENEKVEQLVVNFLLESSNKRTLTKSEKFISSILLPTESTT